jgi:hypothetical protein
MSPLGIDKIVFGVEDMTAAQKSYRDFGPTESKTKAKSAA